MTVKEVKQLDMVDYLSSLGFKPAKISNNSYWYHSPLHGEKTPSFKVNRKLNRWYDFAEGKGGNIVDFGIRYHNCDVSDFLQRLDTVPKVELKRQDILKLEERRENMENSIKVISEHSISSYSLLNYLKSRRISIETADEFLKEVRYQISDRIYYALGFKNDSGGYELRNASFKGSSSPKDITFLNNDAREVAVFEGFFNFLSYKNMYYKQEEPLRNFLILNSTSFFEKSIPQMQAHNQVHLYLDNDKTGQKCTSQAMAIDKEKFRDQRQLYQKYDDLNDWLMHIGQSQKKQIKLKP